MTVVIVYHTIMDKIILLTGNIGSGKSEAARHLAEYHGYWPMKFAGPLKDMLRTMGLSEAHIEGEFKEVKTALLGGKSPREAMESLGSWGRQTFGADHWASMLVGQILAGSHRLIVVDDTRYRNEIAVIKMAFPGKVLVVNIVRPGKGRASKHESANQDLPYDHQIINSGSLQNFHIKLDMLP